MSEVQSYDPGKQCLISNFELNAVLDPGDPGSSIPHTNYMHGDWVGKNFPLPHWERHMSWVKKVKLNMPGCSVGAPCYYLPLCTLQNTFPQFPKPAIMLNTQV